MNWLLQNFSHGITALLPWHIAKICSDLMPSNWIIVMWISNWISIERKKIVGDMGENLSIPALPALQIAVGDSAVRDNSPTIIHFLIAEGDLSPIPASGPVFCLFSDWLSIVWAYSEQETANGPRITGVDRGMLAVQVIILGSLLLIWINFNPSMDK